MARNNSSKRQVRRVKTGSTARRHSAYPNNTMDLVEKSRNVNNWTDGQVMRAAVKDLHEQNRFFNRTGTYAG